MKVIFHTNTITRTHQENTIVKQFDSVEELGLLPRAKDIVEFEPHVRYLVHLITYAYHCDTIFCLVKRF